MPRVVSDYEIRLPESAEPGACLEITKCLKIASAPETPRGAKEQSWCYVNAKWQIYSEQEPPPPTQTITLQGAHDIVAATGIVDDLLQIGCPFNIQAVVICDDLFEEVITFPGVSLSSNTPDNGYGYGVPGVDTGAPPPSTDTFEGTWFGSKVNSRILTKGIAAENSAPDIIDSPISSLFFCDNPTCGITGCGSAEPSNGCRTAFAIYDDGDNPIIAKYHISSTGTVDLLSTEQLPNTNGLVSGTCLNNRVIVTDGTCIFTNCGADGLTKVTLPDAVPAGSILALASSAGVIDHIYALFGTSGVIHSRNGRTWEVVLDDGFFPSVDQQTGIVAAGDVVATFGEDTFIQVNNNGGGGAWASHKVLVPDTYDVVGIGIDLPNPFNTRYAFLYPLVQNDANTSLKVFFSGDLGVSFELRKDFTATVLNQESISIFATVAGSRVYLSYDSVAWVNFSYACDCNWVEISPQFACGSTLMAVCPFDPNTVLMISDGVCLGFARNDVAETPSTTPATDAILNITDNDRPASGETIDTGTLVLVGVLPPDTQSITFNVPAAGDVTVKPDDGFEGVITFDYNVDDTGGNILQATVKIIVGNPDSSVLVC